MHEICRKDYLARNLTRLSRLFPKDYNFFPKTWILPHDYVDFKQFASSTKNACYIAKPDHGSQGKGIYLFRKSKEIMGTDNGTDLPDDMIVQSYLKNPLLIDGYKFDLRGLR
jgi:tubulin polyglutamylase TTLL6/13